MNIETYSHDNSPPKLIVPEDLDLPNLMVGPWEIGAPEASITYDYEVKSWPWFFSKMIAGQKKHDMRDKRDRAYKVGDKVLFREWDPTGGDYTGRSAVFEITYITSNDSPCAMSSAALDRNFVILSVNLLKVSE
jgi:hypothetical protein